MQEHLPGFEAPVHRALVEPILLGGAPRSIANLNGTVSAALGLGLQQWLAGLVLWAAGHSLAVLAARRDPDFIPVLVRHLRQGGHWSC
ncbi:MAG: VirB3 family type IV secretion system protein [Sphingomicrobium sp.]